MPIKTDWVYYYQKLGKTFEHRSYYPVISNVSVSPSGLVTWTTDVASTSQVIYGGTIYLGQSTLYDSTPVTSHSVQLPVFLGFPVCYFKVQSFYLESLSISDLYVFIPSTATGLVLISPNNNRWAVTVLPTGNLDTEPVGAGGYEPNPFVLLDSLLSNWTITISNSGNLITTHTGSGGLANFIFVDSNMRSWTLTVNSSGDLVTI